MKTKKDIINILIKITSMLFYMSPKNIIRFMGRYICFCSNAGKALNALTSQALVAQVCNPSYSGAMIRRIVVGSQPWQNGLRDPISKTPSIKRAGGVAQGVKRLLSRHEALSLNRGTTKNKLI
jgi:hypothetical protein